MSAVRRRAGSWAGALGLTVLLVGCGVADAEGSAPSPSTSAAPSPSTTTNPASPAHTELDVSAELQQLEEDLDGRVGVSSVQLGSGRTVDYRQDEPMGFASTFKTFLAAEVLRQVPEQERGETLRWTQADVDRAGWSPVTGEHVEEGLTILELAEAAMRQTDNTATNVLLERIGGLDALGAGLAALGDTTTEVADDEPGVNDVEPGSTENTTTPATFTANLATLLSTDHLAEADLALLRSWMTGNATGDDLVRAGAPDGWEVLDKSGGAGAMRNDLAIVIPPDGDPIVLTVLTTRTDPGAEWDDALVSGAAEIVLAAYA